MSPAVDPLEVWRMGHQAFFALTQGLVVHAHLASEAIEAADWPAARRWLHQSISLLTASTAAMRLATAFEAEAYAEVVRPSMHAPALPIDLSGMLSTDHRAFLSALEP
ncbi:MAG: hypothetical protein KC620_21875, partial [Myxococcales bacterium]|nr:hypothetical protein [Myxococcales bacterium]